MDTLSGRVTLEWANEREADAIDLENSGPIGAYLAVIEKCKEAQKLAKEKENDQQAR